MPTAAPTPAPSVVFVRKWGTLGSEDGEFWFPKGVAVASDGSVYVADTENMRIQKFTPEGVFVSKWGARGLGDGQFEGANGVAVASDGSIYVADTSNHRIQKFSMGP
jgi:DNA-binding beta-propeller fold protein YncE